MRNSLSIPLFWGGGTPLKPDRQSLLRLMQPVLFLLMLMTGNFALATGLIVQVNGDTAAIPAATTGTAVTLTATTATTSMFFTADGTNVTVGTCATIAGATSLAGGSFSCSSSNPTASGSVTVKVDKVPANYAVIWTGACEALTPTVTAGATAADPTSSQVTVSVPATGGSITCAANITTINLFDVSASTTGLPLVGAVPLGPTSCINFGYVTTGSTPVTKPIAATWVGTAPTAPAPALTSVGIEPYPQEFQVGTSPSTNPFVGTTYASAKLTIPATGATTYQLTSTTHTGSLPSFDLIFDPSKVTATVFPYTVTGKRFNVISNDPAVNNFKIPLIATVVQNTKPKIQVTDATGNTISNGTTVPYDLGTTTLGTPISRTFTVKNVGYSTLTLTTPFTTAGTGTTTMGMFNINSPTTTSLSFPPAPGCPGQTQTATSGSVSTTFDVVLSANQSVTTPTTYTGTVTLTSDDNGIASSTFTFPVKGTVNPLPPPSPEIAIFNATTETKNGETSPVDFGSTAVGTPVTKSITLKNVGVGSEDLLITSINFFGSNGQPSTSFKTVGTVANRVSQLSETTVTFQFSPSQAGTFNETVEIYNTDRANDGQPAENPFRFAIKGVATGGTTGGSDLALSIAPAPTNGTVASDTGGINCGGTSSTCTANYTTGATVKLTATPASGATFTSWSGNCSGTTNPLSLTMDAAKTCSANFSSGGSTGTSPSLTVAKTGNGKITSQPTGIDCGTTGTACSSTFSTGTSLTLTATPDTGATFTSWTGDCASAGNNPTATLTMDATKSCAATFGTGSTTGSSFSLTLTPPTSGIITSQPSGIHCGTGNSSCSGTFTANNIVALTATPDTGATFSSWGGDCTGSTNQLIVTMDKAKNCTATFTPAAAATQTLTVTKTGSGSISSNPVGISCGVDCSKAFTQGSSVVLTAMPDTGATFTSWSGSCAGSTASVTVTMDAAKSCTATFTSSSTGTCSNTNLNSCATTTSCAAQGGTFVDSISGTGLTSQCNSVPKLTIPNTSTSSVGITTSGSRPTSTAQISGGTSVNGSVFSTPSAASSTQNVTWAGNLKVAATDVGKQANILMVIGIEPPAQTDLTGYDGGTDTVYFGVDQTKQLYKVNLYADLVKDDAGDSNNIPGYFPDEVALMTSRPLLSNVTLTDSLSVNLWSGTLSTLINNAVVKSSLTLSAQAKFYVFIGYALTSDPQGSIVYNPVPVETTLVQ